MVDGSSDLIVSIRPTETSVVVLGDGGEICQIDGMERSFEEEL
jgi:hypothetical protein